MTARMTNPATILPGMVKAVPHLLGAVETAGIPVVLRELIGLRISQINGCAACVYAHAANLRAEDESTDRLDTLPVWRESPFFTDAERAALALAESATRLADSPTDAVLDAVWDEAADHFDEKELAGLIVLIGTMNFFNRLNVTIKEPAGVTW
ncbi:carboxymuconolactone decarboxylase family protein [Gordonia soli]|uniref:Carboxymuconolactone decarboxylase family protein n=1 Tax=Gordonia soli NBRC 108243 TaxID=1223545 RepID=M0QEW1_9ACTN|nr:carboxymuconolactone decarboxylase family protein [Gordonia soli]GAC66984.1 carboxymuconolactone decarboxylase family protein [Gordonia soli NBRC 108243]